MKRRKFLKTGALGMAIPTSVFGKEVPKRNKNNPVIVSTHPVGMRANKEALKALQNNGSALDAVEAGARISEADPDDNYVGIGGLPDEQGNVTLDACIMDHNGDCGSVAFIQNIMHPVSVARKVMEDTKHVMLAGKGATQFAVSKGFKEINLLTDDARKQWKDWEKNRIETTPHEPTDTVSILAQDKDGNMSGACTTSGWAYKMHGRVGDGPIIGAGLYVDNQVGSAAVTGLGEEIIKACGSFLVVEFMRQGYGPSEACEQTLKRVIDKYNGNPKDFQMAFVALRKDGKTGAACLKWSFEYAVTKGGESKLHKVNGLL